MPAVFQISAKKVSETDVINMEFFKYASQKFVIDIVELINGCRICARKINISLIATV